MISLVSRPFTAHPHARASKNESGELSYMRNGTDAGLRLYEYADKLVTRSFPKSYILVSLT